MFKRIGHVLYNVIGWTSFLTVLSLLSSGVWYLEGEQRIALCVFFLLAIQYALKEGCVATGYAMLLLGLIIGVFGLLVWLGGETAECIVQFIVIVAFVIMILTFSGGGIESSGPGSSFSSTNSERFESPSTYSSETSSSTATSRTPSSSSTNSNEGYGKTYGPSS